MLLCQGIARDCRDGHGPTSRLQTLLGWNKNVGTQAGVHGQEPASLADHLDTPNDLLLQGSVGKTYVSAVALQLVHEGKIGLDDKIKKYLGLASDAP